MTKSYLSALTAGIALAVATTACINTSTMKSEKIDGIEWDVTVNRVIELNDTALGINPDSKFTVADTSRINAGLKDLSRCGNITIGWTLPTADGAIWLVAYDNEPVLSEKVSVTEANSMPCYDGDIQVGFKLANVEKWEAITRDNIGKRLAVIVNGQLMNAPQVNSEITSGGCSVSIPADVIHDYLPDLDLAKLKQK